MTKEVRAHAASTTSQDPRRMPHAGAPEVKAMEAGMKATSEMPRTAPTMQDRTLAWAKSARPCSERGSRRRVMRPNMSVSFRG